MCLSNEEFCFELKEFTKKAYSGYPFRPYNRIEGRLLHACMQHAALRVLAELILHDAVCIVQKALQSEEELDSSKQMLLIKKGESFDRVRPKDLDLTKGQLPSLKEIISEEDSDGDLETDWEQGNQIDKICHLMKETNLDTFFPFENKIVAPIIPYLLLSFAQQDIVQILNCAKNAKRLRRIYSKKGEINSSEDKKNLKRNLDSFRKSFSAFSQLSPKKYAIKTPPKNIETLKTSFILRDYYFANNLRNVLAEDAEGTYNIFLNFLILEVTTGLTFAVLTRGEYFWEFLYPISSRGRFPHLGDTMECYIQFLISDCYSFIRDNSFSPEEIEELCHGLLRFDPMKGCLHKKFFEKDTVDAYDFFEMKYKGAFLIRNTYPIIQSLRDSQKNLLELDREISTSDILNYSSFHDES